MLAGVDLQTVIRDAGHDRQLDLTERERLYAKYKLDVPNMSPIIAPFSASANLGDMLRKDRPLLCSVLSWTDPHFAHAVVIHEKTLYDPALGVNPAWPWDRVIWRALPVVRLMEVNSARCAES